MTQITLVGLWFALCHSCWRLEFQKSDVLWQSIHLREVSMHRCEPPPPHTHTPSTLCIWAVLLIVVFIRRFLAWTPLFCEWTSKCLHLYVFSLQLIFFPERNYPIFFLRVKQLVARVWGAEGRKEPRGGDADLYLIFRFSSIPLPPPAPPSTFESRTPFTSISLGTKPLKYVEGVTAELIKCG